MQGSTVRTKEEIQEERSRFEEENVDGEYEESTQAIIDALSWVLGDNDLEEWHVI